MTDVKSFRNHVDDTEAKRELVEEEIPMDEETKRIDRETVMRLDMLLMPMTLMLYLLAWLDRANVGNARVAGLEKDLKLTDLQYKTAITVTYVPYVLSELPSNLLLKIIGPRILLPTLCALWGLVTTLQSQVHNYPGFLACRFFLGLLEGGLFPGIVLFLSNFYRRHELQVRIALFFSAASLSGAFSGLLAAAIQQMSGVGGMKGWQWIFLLEGLFTICFGLFSFFMLPNGPEKVLTFRSEHAERCVARLKQDGNTFETEAKVTLKEVFSVLKDVHVWIVCLILFSNGACLFGLAYFSPSIVQGFGYSSTKTQLMTVPPYACGFVVTMLTAYISDRRQQRGVGAFVTSGIALIGAAMAVNGRGLAVRYSALVLLVTGVYACAPCLISWVPNNTAGHVRRATAVAMAFISTNVGGIMSTWIYPKESAPYYKLGIRFNLSLLVVAMTLVVAQVLWLRRQNQKKESDPVGLLQGVEDLPYEEQLAKLGDRHPKYKYTY
ncbi:putative MFS transporter [Aspergillus clavatus NRRL 1]|uniref:MFS transporter, putative n=1 Tax=Aspergillus clavatus (strain ATCC 1007 / CBS 513.65 / DSM 816 / NCTC 3887 / NRRL 1 / QM 1276 / 107) TaxID=344612 RepID=A1CN35_ASPCL|nr:MFS transporter, putative [Aspergillus clavatus NRRL 1]EAW08972.1 MFS transporter, putative [Aspergillus clavatus NRRL 1]